MNRAGLRAFLAASLLLVIGTGTAAADHGYWPAGGVDPAKVAGHQARTDANSDAADWGSGCSTRRASGSGDSGLDVYGHVLTADYRLVVVLGQIDGEPLDGPNGVTIFRGATAGQFVWADADGDSRFAGRHEADAGAMFFCGASAMPATDTLVAERLSSPTLWGIGLVLGLLAMVGAIASFARRAPGRRG